MSKDAKTIRDILTINNARICHWNRKSVDYRIDNHSVIKFHIYQDGFDVSSIRNSLLSEFGNRLDSVEFNSDQITYGELVIKLNGISKRNDKSFFFKRKKSVKAPKPVSEDDERIAAVRKQIEKLMSEIYNG